MKKFENPMMEIAYFEAENVITASGDVQGSNVEDARANAVNRLTTMTDATKITVTF